MTELVGVTTLAEWRTALREALKEALRAKQPDVVSALRETLSALDQAEAVPLSAAPVSEAEGAIAGGVSGLGRGDVPRRVLSADEAAGIVQGELRDRREAAEVYAAAGKHEIAESLRRGADALHALIEKLRSPPPRT